MNKNIFKEQKLNLKLFSMEERTTGLITLAFSILCFIFTHIQYNIKCESRIQFHLENCQLEAQAYAFWTNTHNLPYLYTASIIPYLSYDNSHGIAYDIQLESKNKVIKLSPMPSVGLNAKKHVLKQIKHFIKEAHELSIKLDNPEPFFLRWGSILMSLFSLYLILKAPFIHISASNNKLKFLRYHFYSSFKTNIDIDLIKKIDIQYRVTKKGKKNYRLAVILKNREVIPFSENYSFFYYPKKRTADKLNQYLKIKNGADNVKTPTYWTYNPLHILLGLLIIGFVIATYIETL